jgi:hypothetical protein
MPEVGHPQVRPSIGRQLIPPPLKALDVVRGVLTLSKLTENGPLGDWRLLTVVATIAD